MLKSTFRMIASVFIGLLVAFVLVVAVESFGAAVHPLPKDSRGTMEEVCRHVENFPGWALTVVVPAWAVTAFAGSWTAERIGNLFSLLIVGLVLLAALGLNLAMLPYPTWFKVANLLAVPAAIFVGHRWGRRRQTPITDGGTGRAADRTA
jgi:hypothetical protein